MDDTPPPLAAAVGVDATPQPDSAHTAWRCVPRARTRTSGRWLTPARLNGVPLLPPAMPPHAFRLHATLILKAGAEANPPEPLAAVLAEGCQLL